MKMSLKDQTAAQDRSRRPFRKVKQDEEFSEIKTKPLTLNPKKILDPQAPQKRRQPFWQGERSRYLLRTTKY